MKGGISDKFICVYNMLIDNVLIKTCTGTSSHTFLILKRLKIFVYLSFSVAL